MHRIVYVSTAKWLHSPAELESLLIRARQNNARDGITGMLIYHEGCFFQIIEGPETEVDRCFQRISQDERHRGKIVLLKEETDVRLFGAWRMACCDYGSLTAQQKRQFVDLNMFAAAVAEGVSIDDAPKIKVMLLSFLSAFRDLDLCAA